MANPLAYIRAKLPFFTRRSADTESPRRRGWLRPVLLALLAILLLYYPVGMFLAHEVNDDVDYAVPANEVLPNGSRAVSMATSLICSCPAISRWSLTPPICMPAVLPMIPRLKMILP